MKEIEQTIKLGEKVIGRRAVALNGAELEKAIWAGIRETMEGMWTTEGQREDLTRDLERELARLAELGRVHLSFPKAEWRIEIGLDDSGDRLWAEIEIGLTETRKWTGNVGVRANGLTEEIQQKRDSVPDRIRERWGLPTGIEVRTADGRFEKREIKFGGPRSKPGPDGLALQQQVVETETRRAIAGPGETKASLVEEKVGERAGELVREPVRLDKAELLAETVDIGVGQAEVLPVGPLASPAIQAPSGVTIRGKGKGK